MKKNLTQMNSILLLLISTFLFTTSCSKKVEVPKDPVVVPKPPVTEITANVMALSPSTGKADTEVIIVGDNFGSKMTDVKVMFGSKAATITSFSKEQLVVKAPAGAGDSKVSVTVTVGTTAANKLDFDYSNTTRPEITATTPTFFYNSTVKLTGTNFSAVKESNVVRFGNITSTVISATSTSLTVQTPDLGAATTAHVIVTSSGVTSVGKNIAIDADQNKVATYQWTTSTVKPGVIYKSGKFELFGTTQRSIYVLDITLNSSNTLGIGFSTNNTTTTNMCTNYGAVGGVNAGYFPMSGASDKDGYVRINGATAQTGHAVTSAIFTNSALIIHNNVARVRKFTEFVTNLNSIAAAIPVSEAENMIVCGPILITDNEIEPQNMSNSHNTSATARTGVGVSADGKRVFLVVVDTGGGVTGLSTPNLAKVLQALGATQAMNLDGGGSSTMFVTGKGDNGRVNFPYGNTTQRAIRSVVYVK